MNVTCVDRVCSGVKERCNGVEHDRERENSTRVSAKQNKRDKGLTIFILEANRGGTEISPGFLADFRDIFRGLTTGNPLNHGTPSVAIRLIIDGKDVGCGGQREAGSLMLGRS